MGRYLDPSFNPPRSRLTLQSHVSGAGDRVISTDASGRLDPSFLVVPGAKRTSGLNQPVNSGVATVLTYDTTIYSTDGVVQSSDGASLYAPIPGIYRYGVAVVVTASSTGYRDLRVRLNGSNIVALDRRQAMTSAVPMMLRISDEVEMLGGDRLDTSLFQNSGASLTVSSGVPYAPLFWIRYVSAL